MNKDRNNVDLINGPIFKSLILFAIPLLVSMVFQQLYSAVDTWAVGKYLGDSALAAIGASAALFELIVNFSVAIGSGLTIVISRCYGSNDIDKLKRGVAASIVIGIGSAIIITAIAYLALRPILTVLGTPEEIFESTYAYISIITLFLIITFTYNLGSGILRAIGNSVMPLLFLVFSSLLNIGLDLFFLGSLHMGIEGAAIATIIAQGISAVLCVAYIWIKVPLLKPRRKDFVWDKELYLDMIGQGYSMAIMGSIVSIGSVILQTGINKLGTLVIAAHAASRKVYMIPMIPIMSFGMATSTFVGQNMGANNILRIRKAMKINIIFSIVVAASQILYIWPFAENIVKMISSSSEPIVIKNGSMYLKVAAPFYAVLGILVTTRMSLQGMGEKVLPLVSSVIECVGKILFVIFLIPRFEYNAVIWCEPIIWCFMLVQLLLTYWNNKYIKESRLENPRI